MNVRRFCLVVAAIAATWAAIVVTTGGFAIRLGDLRISSRSPVNALLLMLAACAAAWAVSQRGQRGRALAADLAAVTGAVWRRATHPPSWCAPALAAATSVAVVAVGLLQGAFVVGGSDSYGYVSQAEAWASGTFRFEEPLIREFEGRVSREALVPLAYLPTGQGATVVPMYPAGLPMTMAVFQRIGGRASVFYVVPLFAGVAVWATYVMGTRLAGAAVGVSAAVLLATSPSFLYQLTTPPMSDIVVTGWWALALALVLFDGRGAALAAGLAASAAIVTRPNLVPLAVIPGALLMWQAMRARAGPPHVAQRVLLFAAGVIPGCAAVAALNLAWYGSPLVSGYGTFSSLYHASNLWPNLERYPRWIIETQTPVVLMAFAAPWLVAGMSAAGTSRADARVVAISWLCFLTVIFGSYLFYQPFEIWWYLRFLLPAFPPMLVLTSITLISASSRLPSAPRLLLPVAIVGLIAWHGVAYARDEGTFRTGTKRSYAVAGDYVARRLPPQAALLSMQHSGSIRYYSGRATIRFDLLPPTQLDSTLAELRRRGYHPYILLESWEVPMFQQRFAGHSLLAPLDWRPVALIRPSEIRIYDPSDREASLAGRPPFTEFVQEP